MGINYTWNQWVLRSNAPILQKNCKKNIVRHPSKLSNILGTMSISNNHAFFHLWWKENLVKYQNVSKYYENYCRQILDLGKQFNLMIRLEKFLKTSSQDVLMTPWRCLEDVFARHLEEVLKTYWRRLEDVLKTFSKRLQDVLRMSWKPMAKRNILVLIKTSWRRLQDVSWRRMTKANIFVLIKTPSEDADERRLQDVFFKMNVCWVTFKCNENCHKYCSHEGYDLIDLILIVKIFVYSEQLKKGNIFAWVRCKTIWIRIYENLNGKKISKLKKWKARWRKANDKIKLKWKQNCNSGYIYINEYGKTCFSYNLALYDFRDKGLKLITIEEEADFKEDQHPWFIVFFDKKTKVTGIVKRTKEDISY